MRVTRASVLNRLNITQINTRMPMDIADMKNARRDGEKHACGGVQARTRQRSDELADLAPVGGASDCQLWRGCQRKRACRGAAVVELAVIGGGLLYSRIDEP